MSTVIIPQGVMTTTMRQLQDEGRRLRPMRAPGVLLKQTPNGVMRRAIATVKRASTSSADIIPRWL